MFWAGVNPFPGACGQTFLRFRPRRFGSCLAAAQSGHIHVRSFAAVRFTLAQKAGGLPSLANPARRMRRVPVFYAPSHDQRPPCVFGATVTAGSKLGVTHALEACFPTARPAGGQR
jgi:hypothetical protein